MIPYHFHCLIALSSLAILSGCSRSEDTPDAQAERNAPFLVEPQYPSIDDALVDVKEILKPTSYLINDYTGKTFDMHPSDAPLEPIKVGLSWIANDQFAAYYVAQQNGYFRDAGLDVELMPGGPGKNPLGLLVAGKIDFVSSSNGSAVIRIQHSRTGGDVVAVGALFRRYPYAWVGLDPETPSDQAANRDITPEDFRGRRIAAEPGAEYLAAYTLEQMGLTPSDVTMTRTSTQVEPLLEGAFDFMTSWIDNIPRMIEAKGHKNWISWEFADHGWADFGNVIVTSREIAENEPEKVSRYLWALSRAVEYIIENPEESTRIVKAAIPETSLTLELIGKRLAYQAELSLPPDGGPLLRIDPEKWERCAAILLHYGVVEKLPPHS